MPHSPPPRPPPAAAHVRNDALLRHIPAQDYRRVRWRNGLGWTREVMQWPEDGDWDWRASVAEIEADAAFSSFAGIERSLVLLQGEGLALHAEGHTHAGGAVPSVSAVDPPHGRCDFDGDRAVRAVLHAGPVHVFNLMWRRGRLEADLWRRPLVGSMVLFAVPDEQWVVYALAGHAMVGDGERRLHLAAGDSALIAAHAARLRCMIEGGGEILLARLRPVDASGRQSTD